VTMFARPEEYLSLYVTDLGSADTEPLPERSPWSVSSPQPLVEKVFFAGGYTLAELGTPATPDDLFAHAGKARRGDLEVELLEVLIGRSTTELPTRQATQSLLAGGTESMMKYLGNDGLTLWIDRSGKDRSRFARQLSTS
ncbi:MAG: hypothetical protein KDD69_15820, partial [Bdellovibrionales bacterium]|nr:hypothetical protein [Bdellovibrionales bacterium]